MGPIGNQQAELAKLVVKGEQKEKLVDIIANVNKHYKPLLEKLFPEKIANVALQYFRNLGGAPVILLVYVPKIPVEIRPEMSSMVRFHSEHDRLISFISAAALIQNILLLAAAQGLGTCWMTAPKYVVDQINNLLGIEDLELVSAIPIGYPDQKPPAPPRKGNKIRWIGF